VVTKSEVRWARSDLGTNALIREWLRCAAVSMRWHGTALARIGAPKFWAFP
jgi:hypothetical protein